MQDEYFTIQFPSEGLYKEKGSRFIAFARPVSSEDEIKQHLAALKKQYYDARHICYAFRLGVSGELWRAVDDGEPSGTAGKPIHGQLLSNNLTNIVIFVVRYFGGIKLGASGLIKAYRTAAADAILNSVIVTREDRECIVVGFAYSVMNDVMKIIKDEQIETGRQSFEMQCEIELFIRRSLADNFKAKLLRIESVEVKIRL